LSVTRFVGRRWCWHRFDHNHDNCRPTKADARRGRPPQGSAAKKRSDRDAIEGTCAVGPVRRFGDAPASAARPLAQVWLTNASGWATGTGELAVRWTSAQSWPRCSPHSPSRRRTGQEPLSTRPPLMAAGPPRGEEKQGSALAGNRHVEAGSLAVIRNPFALQRAPDQAERIVNCALVGSSEPAGNRRFVCGCSPLSSRWLPILDASANLDTGAVRR
jgi:hypothetical protein